MIIKLRSALSPRMLAFANWRSSQYKKLILSGPVHTAAGQGVIYDPESNKLGIAVATCCFALGTLVPHLKSGVGAIATQAATNPHLGLKGLEKMSRGHSLKDSLITSLNEDLAKDSRQLHGVDVSGISWAWTGKDTVKWSGHKFCKNFI